MDAIFMYKQVTMAIQTGINYHGYLFVGKEALLPGR